MYEIYNMYKLCLEASAAFSAFGWREEVAQLTKRIILDVEFIIRETFQYVTSRFTFNVR